MHIILLTGAALVGVPVLLHLIMRQEPKKLPFPALQFLKLKRRTNQRKMRLRHLLLLALRMFLIALIALALFQPTLLSDRFNIKGERPIACALVIDTSPSMGYVLSLDRGSLPEARKRGPAMLEEESAEDRQRPWTALDEARFRAMELLDELPPGSKIAVIDSADRDGFWSVSLAEARKKIREMKKTKASSRPVTQTLPLAYQLFAKVDQEAAPGQENMPRLLAVFSDRTAPSWDAAQTPYLREMNENVPKPDVIATYIDVGVDKPLNLAIIGVDMKPQIVAANKPFNFAVVLEATGAKQENTVQVRFGDDGKAITPQAVRVEPGATKDVVFSVDGLPPGLCQAEISLQTPDALPSDDVRYLTFHVREPRKVLAVADASPGLGAAAGGRAMIATVNKAVFLLRTAINAKGSYDCEVATTSAFLDLKPADLGRYEAVVFAGLVEPSSDIWDKATAYVDGGGKLIVMPGANELLTDGKDKPPPGYNNKLLPGTLKRWIAADGYKAGVTWAWDAIKAHSMLGDLKEWVDAYGLADNKPQVWGYWEVEPRDKLSVAVSYSDDPDADKRNPALLERQAGQSGRVLLFTTPMDGRVNSHDRAEPVNWNDYPQSWFYPVLVDRALRYLTGDTEDAVFNFTGGQMVLLKWPPDAAARSKLYYLSGPGLGVKDAEIIRGEGESLARIGPDRLKFAGNFLLLSDPADKKRDLKPWRDGFSLNPPADESNFERVPVEQIEALLGPKSVVTSDKERKIQDILGDKFSAPIELFPFLMILLLLFLACENLLSNKFYRRAQPKEGA